jgi:acetoin utilization deacetylase AcuC-like enzyme
LRVFHTDEFDFPLREGHRFPLGKYRELRLRVERQLGSHGLELLVPEAVSRRDVDRVHTADYRERFEAGRLSAKELREIGLPWSPQLVERTFRSVGASLAACRAALEDGRAAYLGGGTHHAFADRGAGFCVLNDGPIALRALQDAGALRRALIVDLDAHQGDGTACILAGDASCFTLSVHCEKNFPFRKRVSDLDVALPAGTGDVRYLEALEDALEAAVDAVRPQLILYLAGADPYEGDRLGRLALSSAGLRTRDALVFDAGERHGIPLAVVMAGGYARPIERTVEIQLDTVQELWRRAAGPRVASPAS